MRNFECRRPRLGLERWPRDRQLSLQGARYRNGRGGPCKPGLERGKFEFRERQLRAPGVAVGEAPLAIGANRGVRNFRFQMSCQHGALRTGGEMHLANRFLIHLNVLAVHFGAQICELHRDTAGGRFGNRG